MSKISKLSRHHERKLNELLISVARFYDIPVSDITGRSRKGVRPKARKVFISYAMKKLKIPSGPLIAEFINQSAAMAVFANQDTDNKYNLKPIYDTFLQFMFEQPVGNYIDYIESIKYFELRLKIQYIYNLGLKRFKINRYLEMFKTDLRDIIFAIHDRAEDGALISLYAWFEDFSTEFFENSNEVMNEFENQGA